MNDGSLFYVRRCADFSAIYSLRHWPAVQVEERRQTNPNTDHNTRAGDAYRRCCFLRVGREILPAKIVRGDEMSNRLYWNLHDDDLLLEFVQWLRREYPTSFKSLASQFLHHKELQRASAPSA